MACPACGGDDRRAIAPGFWECTSPLVSERWVPAGPGGSMRPERTVRPCGHRYHEGGGVTGTTTCACGTFAIGLCAECGSAVCGDHSWMRGDRRLCREHAAAVDAQARAEQAREEHDRRVAQQRRQRRALEAPGEAAARLLELGVPLADFSDGTRGWVVAEWTTPIGDGMRAPRYGILLEDGRLFEGDSAPRFVKRNRLTGRPTYSTGVTPTREVRATSHEHITADRLQAFVRERSAGA